jgi:hypothetical protein
MSHHFDRPTAVEDGRLNLLDLYVFPEAPGTTTLVVGVSPDSGRSSPTTFRPDALYEFVIASDGGPVEDRAFLMSFGEPDADGRQEMRSATLPAGRASLAWRAPNSAPGRNLLAGRNVTAIALQVPDVTFGGINVAL